MFFSSECKTISKQLWARANGSLAHSDLERVETHLLGCESCRREAESYRLTVSLMAHMRQEAVPASRMGWRDLERRLDAASRAPRRSLFPTLAWSGGLVATAALLLLFVAPGVHNMNSAPPQRAMQPTVTKNPTSHTQNRQAQSHVEIAENGNTYPDFPIDPDDSVISTPPASHDLKMRSSTPPIMSSGGGHLHGSVVRVGLAPHNLPNAPRLDQIASDNRVPDGRSPQQIRLIDNVLPPVVGSEEEDQNHPHYVIDTVSSSSSSSGTASGSDGTEEQHPW